MATSFLPTLNEAHCSNNKTDDGTNKCHSGALLQINKRTENHRKCSDDNTENTDQMVLVFVFFGEINEVFGRNKSRAFQILQMRNNGELIVKNKQ